MSKEIKNNFDQKSYKKISYAQKSCLSKAGKLMQETQMLWPGARVGIAVSGGMDSQVLLQVLQIQRRKLPFPIEIMALHVNPGFETDSHLPLYRHIRKQQIAAHFEHSDIGPRAHSSENKTKSPCFFCSWHRRKLLFTMCKEYNLTHLAFGHNSDDLVENFFMNLFQCGRVDGLYPKESYFNGEFELIRPLLLADKRLITSACKKWNLPVQKNPCPSAHNSKRTQIRTWLEEAWQSDKRVRKNIFSALQRWQLDLTR